MRELSPQRVDHHVRDFRKLGVRWVVLSGGEALMHAGLWDICAALKPLRARISLLSTGLLLQRNVSHIREWVDDVIVSLDGDPAIHDQIRNIPRAYERLAIGVEALRRDAPTVRISARCVLQKQNFRELGAIVSTAAELGVDSISFLAADVSSTAFNRPDPWEPERVIDVALTVEECDELESVLKRSFVDHAKDYESGFIVESTSKMLEMLAHYRAQNSLASPLPRRCNAPWVSVVVEPDGSVRPCYFHDPIGNINNEEFSNVVNSPVAVAFRKQLDVKNNPICQNCTCTLNV